MSNKFLDWIKEDTHWLLLTDELLQNVCKKLQNRSQSIPTHIPGWDIPGRWNSLSFRGYISNDSFWRIQEHKHFDCCRILDRSDKQCAIGPVDFFKKAFSLCFEEAKKISASENKKYGIVLSGGGAKGAFQIGVWKYLHENGYDKLITGISGSSVGALNGLLFASGSYENAERTWIHAQQADMTPIGFDLSDLLESLAKAATGTGGAFLPKVTIASAAALSGPLIPSLTGIVSLAAMSPRLMRQLSLSTQKGLKKLIDDSDIDWPNVRSTNKLIYSSISAKTLPHISGNNTHPLLSRTTRLEYRCWAGLTNSEIKDTVLASAALPIAYPSKKIDRADYRDGGIQDNLPIRPLIAANFGDIVVVHLNRANNPDDKKEWADSMAGIDISNINSHIHHVYPPKDFDDGFFAMLTLNPQLSQERIKQGFEAARTYLAHIFPPIKK